MIKQICDGCGKETEINYRTDKLSGKIHTKRCVIDVEVNVYVDGKLHEGEVCYECVRKALDSIQKAENVD